MIKYKIKYQTNSFPYNWVNYDNVLYENKSDAEKVIQDFKEQFPAFEVNIFETIINI